MKNFKKLIVGLFALLSCFALLFSFASCQSSKTLSDDANVVVLYTNDAHCGIDENVGYAGLASYKKEMEKDNYVTLVDAGDAIQGDVIGTVSRGSYLVDIMNKVGYDYAVLGNHEFDYGLDRLSSLIGKAKAQYLNSNIDYSGKKGNLLKNTKPYAIKDYGKLRVAYIGVSTPESLVKSTPKYFMEGDEFVYDFKAGKDLYKRVQNTVNEVRDKGAKVVIVIAHLGVEEGSEPNRSYDLIANTTGIDAVIDGHSHTVMASEKVNNKNGKAVLLTQTGTKIANIGKMVITPKGYITTELISNVQKDPSVTKYIDNIKAKYESQLNKPVAKAPFDLLISREDGTRAVRNRETAIGDLCADAYKAISGADIAFVNGGGIRAPIKSGDISTANIISVHPYGNMLCMCKATGAEILDALELGSMNTQAVASEGNAAVGESGGFLQVAGLKYTIDTSIPSSVQKDENGLFVRVNGKRRVKDVMVQKNGEWQPIDLKAEYKLASHNYKLQDMGDGYSMFKDNEFLLDNVMIDNQVLITYIVDYLGGTISNEYAAPQGRITII